jgi:limonene-1,2-epoxide hydrolase
MPSEAEKVVSDFCTAWTRGNLEELMGFFTEDAVYHNIPLEAAKGKAAIRAVINSFLPAAKSIQFKILHTGSAGNVVFNERIDIFDQKDGKHIELPVAGVFEVTGGKLSAWRDYFDMAMFTKQMG